MSIPTYDRFIEPILRYLAARPDGANAQEVHEASAVELGLSQSDRLELLPSGAQATYKNRAGWAHDRLKRAGLSASPRRGWWQLTEKGVGFARSHPMAIPPEEVARLATVNRRERLRPKSGQLASLPSGDLVESPDDRLAHAYEELRASTADELLETVLSASPGFFERLVLDLLHAMGYGASREDLQHTGRSGDGGIDGIISLDRLGLEKVFVQAKRWQNPVPAEPIQAFYGALAGRRAKKGVFITTSTFSEAATRFAMSVEGLVLIDGKRLCELMMDSGIGVTTRPISIPRIDRDYFEE